MVHEEWLGCGRSAANGARSCPGSSRSGCWRTRWAGCKIPATTPRRPPRCPPPSRRADPGLPDQARQAAVGVMARAVTLRVAVLGRGVLVDAAPVGEFLVRI